MSGQAFFISRYAELGWRYNEVKPKTAIRVNMMNARNVNLVDRLQSLGFRLEKIPYSQGGYWVESAKPSIGATIEYLLGYYSIQEAAAQIPVTLFTDPEDKTVLDACAAPGGKTVQLADAMDNTGVIVALDVNPRRLRALANQLERCRVKNAIVYQMDARETSRLGVKFDRILLDVPCSGNFATDPKWFSRRTLQDVKRNAKRQREILAEAVKVLAEDGEIVYSTCSLEPEENELNIHWAVKNLGLKTVDIDCPGEPSPTKIFGQQLDASVQKCRRLWPSRQNQGFFICKLKKR